MDSWRFLGAALQADGETKSVVTASSIRRRSAAADPSQALQSKAIAIENDLRGTLRNFGLKVKTVKFEARIRELVANFPDLAELVEPLLIVRQALREKIVILHRRLRRSSVSRPHNPAGGNGRLQIMHQPSRAVGAPISATKSANSGRSITAHYAKSTDEMARFAR